MQVYRFYISTIVCIATEIVYSSVADSRPSCPSNIELEVVMVSWITTLILLVVVLVYMIVGGLIFHVLEATHEGETLAKSYDLLRQFLG